MHKNSTNAQTQPRLAAATPNSKRLAASRRSERLAVMRRAVRREMPRRRATCSSLAPPASRRSTSASCGVSGVLVVAVLGGEELGGAGPVRVEQGEGHRDDGGAAVDHRAGGRVLRVHRHDGDLLVEDQQPHRQGRGGAHLAAQPVHGRRVLQARLRRRSCSADRRSASSGRARAAECPGTRPTGWIVSSMWAGTMPQKVSRAFSAELLDPAGRVRPALEHLDVAAATGGEQLVVLLGDHLGRRLGLA